MTGTAAICQLIDLVVQIGVVFGRVAVVDKVVNIGVGVGWRILLRETIINLIQFNNHAGFLAMPWRRPVVIFHRPRFSIFGDLIGLTSWAWLVSELPTR